MECTLCGACCVAPDIAAIDKPLGIRCAHLTADNLCGVYEDRPDICKSYAADKLCLEIAAPTLEERVHNYLAKFGLLEEAARNRALAASSMRASRSLPIVHR
ncbi:MAG: YkgJ family cysteine cluster protein [Deltaproteobacteria bacterium]|nr:YkgJ family cysteine cluster protein [Deltaproteobacteria bacterium]